MGIRVHKNIGYALTDVKENDDRFNPVGYMSTNIDEQEMRWDREGFIEYFDTTYPNDMFTFTDLIHKDWEVYDSIVYDGEYGLENVLMIIPPESVNRWKHHDDQIDYYEETINHKQESRVQVLHRSLYPHEFWIDKRDGRRIEHLNILYLLKDRTNKIGIAEKQLFSEKLGFNSYSEFVENATPGIPSSVIALCKYVSLFKDENTIYQLKPAIYVYWS